jgi:glycosyltransferase involved in cell wall biosynthesis
MVADTDSAHVLDGGRNDRNGHGCRPRILIVATLAEVGGVGSYIAMLLPALVERFDIVVAAHGPGPLRDVTSASGARFVPLTHMRRPINPFRDLLALVEFIRVCRRVRPDIVHANSSKAGVIVRLAAALARVPIRIFSVHGWAFSVPGMNRTVLWADRLVRPLTSYTICVSAYDRELGIAARTCVGEKTVVIHNGIDAGRFAPAKHGTRDVPVLVSVGRLAAQKDYGTLVHALSKLDRATYRALIVGSGPDELMLVAEIKRLGLADSIELLGERADVARILSSADAFVLSSIYESLPISILEAMAAALPVAATRVGGVPELVLEGETGFVVPVGDVDALAEALRTLIGDPELRRRFGRAGRARVEASFGIDRFRDEHIELYRRELSRRGRSSARASPSS